MDSLPGGRRLDAALALAALTLALIGELYFKALKYPWDGAVFFAFAIVFFLVLAARFESRTQRASWLDRLLALIRGHPASALLAALSLALAYTAVRLLQTRLASDSYWDVFALWIASLVCYAAAFVRISRVDLRASRRWLSRHRWEILAVAALTAVAAALRLVGLGASPNVISGDEGRIGLLARSVLQGRLNDMLATAYGHSTLYIFIMAAAMKLAGVNPTGLRLMSAVGGFLTVPALYVLARRFFGMRVGLIAAALLTVSHIHLHFSRIIVAGSIQDALFATAALYLLLTGLEHRSTARLLLSALVMGLHVYIYMGARLIILLVPVYLLLLLITSPRLVLDNVARLAIMAGGLLVTVCPMAVWVLAHPADFMARANQVGIFQSGWLANEANVLHESQAHILATQLAQAFLSVNAYPATAFYNASLPMLDYLTGAIFMLGLAYSLAHLTDRRHLLLNGWFWSGVVVGGALVVLPAISAYRILIVFPAVCVFVALGWDRLVEYTGRAMPGDRWLPTALTVAFVAAFGFLNLRAYFVDYVPSCRYEDPNTRFASLMGQTLGEVGPAYHAYLFGYPRIWYGIHPSVDFLSGGIPITDVKEPLTGARTFPDPGGNAIFFFTPERVSELTSLEHDVPGGKVREIRDCSAVALTVYQVERAAAP